MLRLTVAIRGLREQNAWVLWWNLEVLSSIDAL